MNKMTNKTLRNTIRIMLISNVLITFVVTAIILVPVMRYAGKRMEIKTLESIAVEGGYYNSMGQWTYGWTDNMVQRYDELNAELDMLIEKSAIANACYECGTPEKRFGRNLLVFAVVIMFLITFIIIVFYVREIICLCIKDAQKEKNKKRAKMQPSKVR